MLMKIEDVFILHEKKCEFTWWENKKEKTIIHWGPLKRSSASGKNYQLVQNFRVSLDEKFKIAERQNTVKHKIKQ